MLWIWIPVLLLGYWGYAYIRACFLSLASVHGAVEYQQPTKGGPLTFRAENVQVDLEGNLVHLGGLSIRQSNGLVLAKAQHAVVRGAIPSSIGGPSDTIHAHVTHVSALLQRLPNGRLAVLDYLPEATTATGKVPYSIDIVGTKLQFEDHRSAKVWRTFAAVDRVRIDGIGSRFVGSGIARIDNVGAFTAELRKNPDAGITIDGDAQNMDVVPVLRHFVDTPDVQKLPVLRNISAQHFIISGPVRLFFPNKGAASYEANVVADTREFNYRNEFLVPSGHFEGVLTHSGLKGVVTATGAGVSATYVGALSWGKDQVLGGSLKASIARMEDAPKWIQGYMPKGARFENAVFNGWISYTGGGTIGIDGQADAAFAQYNKELLVHPIVKLNATADRVALDLQSGTWNGSPVHGALNYVPKGRAIEGLLVANRVSLGSLAQRAGVKNIEGAGDVQALFTGTASQPSVSLRATGTARTWTGAQRYNLGHIVAAADYSGNVLNLTRLAINGPQGTATAVGSWNSKTNAISADVVGDEIPLSALSQDVKGDATFIGKIGGTIKSPVASGRAEVYGAEYNGAEIPLVMADFTADRRTVVAKNLVAYRDAARASGNVALDLKTKALSGTAKIEDVQLGSLLGKEVAGTVDVSNATISGTLDHIHIDGTFDGRDIVANGVKIDSVTGKASMSDTIAALTDVNAVFDQGTVALSGSYDLNTMAGSAAGHVTNLGLSELARNLPPDTTVAGLLNAAVSASFDKSGIKQADIKGNVSNVAVNDVLLGNGTLQATAQGPQWNGSLNVGQLDRFLEVNNATYNTKSDLAHADIVAHNLTLHNFYAAAKPYIAADTDPPQARAAAKVVLPESVVQQLDSAQGDLDVAATLNGKITNPDLQIPTFAVNNLNLAQSPSGTITASATRANGVWDIPEFTWTGGPGVFTAGGTIAEHGNIDFRGELQNVDPNWLALWAPALSRFSGKSTDFSFVATGPTKSPVIESSLDYAEGDPRNRYDRRTVSVRATVQQGSITASGEYYYNGFTGPLSAFIPFEYPFTIPKDRAVTADVSLPPRPLKDMVGLVPWLDPKRTVGTISGAATVSGPIDKLQITGKANVNAPVVAANDVDTTLNDFVTNAGFDGNALTLNATGTGSNGGTVSVQGGRVQLGNISDVLRESLDTILRNPVAGTFSVQNFRVIQKGSFPTNAVLDANVNASGPLRSPLLQGFLAIDQGKVSTPTAPASAGEPFRPVVNPRFAIDLRANNPVTMTFGTGTFQLTGAGRLAGSLALPDLDTQMLVEKGTVRLPNARINIDPGGTIHVVYQATPYGTPNARADIDLTGTTALTANPYGGTIQRYDIDLQMTGNLMEPGGLHLVAQSDPPDLSPDVILTLLGQGGLFTSTQGVNANPFNPNQQLAAAFFTALPLLFDPLTQQVATSLGLDYLNVEYNAYEKVAITAAKSFGKHLVLSARKQLSQPLPGQRQTWDVRLSYRLPFKGRLRNLNLAVGADQDRPWKVSLEYGFRF